MSTQEARARGLAQALSGDNSGPPGIGGVPLSELLRRAPTPFYVYSGDAIVRQARRVRAALGPETSLFYSLKANPSLGVCQLYAREGVGAEVASSGELVVAEAAGFPPERTVFAGPGKTDDELSRAVRLGILAVNVESVGEMERLAAIAAREGRQAQAAVRVNPAAQVKGAQMRMGGGPQQFGVDEERVPALLQRFRGHPRVRVAGLHVYAGTQMFDVEAVLPNLIHTVELARGMADGLGRPLEVIDFGGGFGVPYYADQPEFDLDAFATGYRQVVERCKDDPMLARATLIVELGRYLAAGAGVYVTRVVDVKESRGKRYVVTDGGMNHHITATGNFGQVFRKPFPIALLDRPDAPCDEQAAIVGPCCTPLDTIATGIPLPKVDAGDVIGIFNSGAYGYSASSLHFLSHPTPAELLVLQGNVHVLRPAGAPERALDGQAPLVMPAQERGIQGCR